MLWRMTAGRFTNPAAVVERSQGRVDTLKSEVVEYAAQLEKLEVDTHTHTHTYAHTYTHTQRERERERGRIEENYNRGSHTRAPR